jgi:tetratricopeptide (TPR) repeat protein
MTVRRDGVTGRLAKAARTNKPIIRVTLPPRWARFLVAAGAQPASISDSMTVEFEAKVDLAARSLDVSIEPPPPSINVSHSLPPDTAEFTGRYEELDSLDEIDVSSQIGPSAIVCAIAGMPGVGKTTFAVHAAHLMRDRYPDRQLFIDLHSHTQGQDPTPPESALASLLAAVGVDARYLPNDLEGRSALWRAQISGQRTLLILDNAASTSQIAPLLPGGAGSLVIVTSRRRLVDLPGTVVPISLEALSPSQASELFLRLAPRAISESRENVAGLVQLVGYLPLVISLVARVYVRHPSWTLTDLAREIRTNKFAPGQADQMVAAAIELSYQYLPNAQKEFFRCLGQHPGTTVDRFAAANLAGISSDQAARHLNALYNEGLLIEASYNRYTMHDLIRRFAADRASMDSPKAGNRPVERLLDYYQRTAALADAQIARQVRSKLDSVRAIEASPHGTVPELTDRAKALAWVRAERGNVLASLAFATSTGRHARVVALTAGMAALLRLDGPWTEAIRLHGIAVESAQHLHDRLGQAIALSNLGAVLRLTGDHPAAIRAFEQALAISRDIDDRLGEADALRNLGGLKQQIGDYLGATEDLVAALSISRDVSDPLGEAEGLRNLGVIRRLTGDYPEAAEALADALSLSRQLGDLLGEADALRDLGTVSLLTADYPGAAKVLERALRISRDLDDRLGEAGALSNLGAVQRAIGDYPEAARALERALSISRELGDRVGEADALRNLGVVNQSTGEYPESADALAAALSISRDVGDRAGEASALSNLGAVRRITGDYSQADSELEEALNIYRSLGDIEGEAEALNEMGQLYCVRGDPDQAETYHRHALNLARKVGSSWTEAHALAGLGRSALTAGRLADAQNLLRMALALFQRIGAVEAIAIAAELESIAQ